MAVAAGFDLRGLTELKTTLARLSKEQRKRAAGGLYRIAEEIMAESKELVPVDLGTLKNSGTVMLPEFTDEGVEVHLGYGGAAAAYAVTVHEHMGLGAAAIGVGGEVGVSRYDPPSWQIAEARGQGVQFGVGGPKYLERPMLDRAKTLEADLADEMETP